MSLPDVLRFDGFVHDGAAIRAFLLGLLIFGFAPAFILRLLVALYPSSIPESRARRRELLGEFWYLSYRRRPIFVAAQLGTAFVEVPSFRLRQVVLALEQRRMGQRVKSGELWRDELWLVELDVELRERVENLSVIRAGLEDMLRSPLPKSKTVDEAFERFDATLLEIRSDVNALTPRFAKMPKGRVPPGVGLFMQEFRMFERLFEKMRRR
jgi:hypothetical protein